MKILSWNVNGIRAADKKGLFDWFRKQDAEIVCLQEIKAMPEQVPPHLKNIPGYEIYWNSAERKGYSGVVTITKQKPIEIKKGFDTAIYWMLKTTCTFTETLRLPSMIGVGAGAPSIAISA